MCNHLTTCGFIWGRLIKGGEGDWLRIGRPCFALCEYIIVMLRVREGEEFCLL